MVMSSSLRMISSALGDAGFAHRAEAVEEGAADIGALGAERERLQHVLARADAAVDMHLDAVADRLDDRRQRRDRRQRAVELAAAMVGDDDRVGAAVARPCSASSGSRMPFRISLPPQRSLIHSTSSQDSVGSNCSRGPGRRATARSPTPLAWPTMLPKRAPLGAEHRRRTSAAASPMSMRFGSVRLGGAERPLRGPCGAGRGSAGRASAPAPSSRRLGAVDQAARRSRGRASRRAGTRTACPCRSATSSIEQMLIVESVNGTPNSSAAWAARISPSACCMPVMPVGASATGIATGSPTIVRRERAVGHVDGDALAQLDPGEIRLVGAVGALGPGARSRHSRRTSSARGAWPARADLRCR